MKYNIIYADPPWSFGSRLRNGSKTRQHGLEESYKSQSLDWIKNVPIQDIIAKDAILFLWTIDAHLGAALEVISSWRFKYKTIAFIWNKKEKTGKQVCYYGHWTLKGSEICLLGTKGKIHSYIKSHKIRQLVEAQRTTHSKKPDEVRNRIVQLMGDISRIELFAKEKHAGWKSVGYEIDGKDLYHALKELI